MDKIFVYEIMVFRHWTTSSAGEWPTRQEKQERWTLWFPILVPRESFQAGLQGGEAKQCPEVFLRWQDRVVNLGSPKFGLKITGTTTGDEPASCRGEAGTESSDNLKRVPWGLPLRIAQCMHIRQLPETRKGLSRLIQSRQQCFYPCSKSL